MSTEEIAGQIFGAYDIRGIYGEQISEEIAERLGKSLGTLFAGSARICVGMDGRDTSAKIKDSFIEGLKSTGCKIVFVGKLPNPVSYFHTWKEKFDAGAYLTASHNPAEYAGVKFMRATGVSFIEELSRMREIFLKGEFTEGDGSVEEYNPIEDYKRFWKERIKIDRKIKIVVDSFYGAAAFVIPEIFEQFGIECVCLRNEPKGDFGGIKPEPNTETIEGVKKKVIEEAADFGVGFDGDSDRSLFVDDKGRHQLGGPMLIFFAKFFVKKGDKIVATIDCPSEIKSVTEENGGIFVGSKIGHSFIEEKVLSEGAVFGGEQSSHFYPGEYYVFSDGIASSIILAQIISKTGKKISDVIDETGIHPSEKIYIQAENHDIKNRAMDLIKERLIREHKGLEYTDVDGIKIFLNEIEWVLVRVSNTTPKINIAIEAENEDRLKELIDRYSKILGEEINRVKNG